MVLFVDFLSSGFRSLLSPLHCFTMVVTCSVCACLDLSVSSSSLGLGRAAVCDCGTPWTFLLPFLVIIEISLLLYHSETYIIKKTL